MACSRAKAIKVAFLAYCTRAKRVIGGEWASLMLVCKRVGEFTREKAGLGGTKSTMTGVSTMTDTRIKRPWHLWLVGLIAVLFNAIGAFDYVMSMVQGSSYMAGAGMTPAQIAHYQTMPIWMTAVWTIGVWGAMLGSVLILLRNRLAFLVFAVSLAAFLVSLIYTYVLTDGGEIMGRSMAITSVVITALLLFFMWYSWLMTKRSVLT